MTPRRVALAFLVAGAALVVAGVALVYVPAGLVLAGVGIGAFGLVGIDVDAKRRAGR